MINGYEDVFGINNGRKVFDLIKVEDLYHKKGDNGPTRTSSGLDASVLFYGFVEQTIGKDIYQEVNKAYYAVETLCKELNVYQEKRNTKLKNRAETNDLEREMLALQSKIKYLSSKNL